MSPLLLVLVVVCVEGAPLPHSPHDLEPIIDRFLEALYDKLHNQTTDIYDQMQGDQPDNNVQGDISKFLANFSTSTNMTDYYIQTSKNRHREVDVDDRDKNNWIQVLKENILRQIGRSNMTSLPTNSNAMNMTMSPQFNSSVVEDDQITEKIRSYYPSCDAPSNMDQELWREENVMNLFFNNFDQSTDEKGLNIATATLRLYRVPTANSTKVPAKTADCDSSASSEEDKLLRVSIYWYTRSVRKKRVKRRLSDSKVIQETARWVELSVKPATRAWSRGRNLGLAVMVEDQEGNILKADRLFKGALCTPLRSQSPLSSSTLPANQTSLTNEFIAYFSAIQQHPYIVTYQCYQQ